VSRGAGPKARRAPGSRLAQPRQLGDRVVVVEAANRSHQLVALDDLRAKVRAWHRRPLRTPLIRGPSLLQDLTGHVSNMMAAVRGLRPMEERS
jgi:hypothetical protein